MFNVETENYGRVRTRSINWRTGLEGIGFFTLSISVQFSPTLPKFSITYFSWILSHSDLGHETLIIDSNNDFFYDFEVFGRGLGMLYIHLFGFKFRPSKREVVGMRIGDTVCPPSSRVKEPRSQRSRHFTSITIIEVSSKHSLSTRLLIFFVDLTVRVPP